MKTYVIISGIANMVAGGPIYYRNKIRYMEELGWNVVVLPINSGEIYIKGLEKYADKAFPFILENPSTFTKNQRNSLLNLLAKEIPENQSEIIIETGTDFTSYWGEALAEKLNAKHFILHLDENNPRIDETVIDFYKFKYQRGELACIGLKALHKLFDGYMEITEDNAAYLSAYCSNSIEDYDSPIIDNIPNGDYYIGSIGRLDKIFVNQIIDGIIAFANNNPEKILSVTFFGGGSKERMDEITNTFSPYKNIRLYITDYIFPIPFKAIQKMDVFISGAASTRATARYGVPSMRIDVYNGKIIGISDCLNTDNYIRISDDDSVFGCLEYFFKNNMGRTYTRTEYFDIHHTISEQFDKHMEFIHSSAKSKEYFDVSKFKLSKKKALKKILRGIVGIRFFNKLKNKEFI